MTDNNPDQDDFDPSLEEGAEDFGYEEESFGDEEFSDESWDEGFEEGHDEVAADDKYEQPAKKKGGLFNIILIATAVLGGGAFIYLKVLSPSAGTVPQPTPIAEAPAEMPAETQQAAMPAAPLTPDPVAPVAPPPAPALASDGMLPTLAPEPMPALTPDAAPAPEEAPAPALAEAPATDLAPLTPPDTAPVAVPDVPVAPAPQQPVEVATAPPMPAPITAPAAPDGSVNADSGFNPGLPSAKDIMLAPASPAPEGTTQAGGISADAAKGIEQKLSVLLARLDTFEGRITNLESGLHQVSSKISTLESKPAAVVDLEGVNSTLQSLERKVSALEKSASAAPAPALAPAATPTQDVSKIDQPTFVPAAPDVSEPAPKTVTAVDTPKVEAVAPKPVVKTAPAATAARSVSWVLRSAQPGAAMVVPKAGGDMRTVRVGDNLSGLGRIIAIEQRGSRWVVQGTQGTLTH